MEPRENILSIMEMGTMAPTSCNRQAYKLIVVDNKDKKICENKIN